MRELERPLPSLQRASDRLGPVAILGAGRLGTALTAALRAAGLDVRGPLGHDPTWPDPLPAVVLLCVPDAVIAAAAAQIPAGPLLGHCSGATGLEVLGDRTAFSLHPLMTVATGAAPASLIGAGAAIDGSSPEAIEVAQRLAAVVGLEPVRIESADRVAYHAAASIASNFLITLEAAAERLGETAGLPRERLVPLVRTTVENWARLGPERALTGPVARGDELTVAHQRAAVAERTPELLELFDVLTAATARLAGQTGTVPC